MSLTCTPTLSSPISSLNITQSPLLLHRSFLRRRHSVKVSAIVAGAGAGAGGEMVGDMAVLLQLVDPWAPTANSQFNIINSQSIASQLFAASLFPYLGFLYHITRSNSAPKLTLFGFYFLLAFVAATIPAGIYAKLRYGTSLANVDWLHGGAESLLTLTNLFIVLGLRKAVRDNDYSDENEMSISENDYSDGNETSISESESVEENIM